MIKNNDIRRFESYTIPEPNTGCWFWLGAVSNKGYGRFRKGTKTLSAHRAAFELFVGSVLEQQVLHRCDMRDCVNPDHLFLGTHGDNMKDMVRKGRSAHPYGELHPSARLSVIDIHAIRASGARAIDIAKQYGISAQHAGKILNRLTWGHL